MLNNLNPTLVQPDERLEVAINQIFVIRFPGAVITTEVKKENLFLSFESLDQLWCNIVIDTEDPNLLYVYPSELINLRGIVGNKINLFCSGIKYTKNDVEYTSEDMNWSFIIGSFENDYDGDSYALHTTPTTSDTEAFILEYTTPEVGTPNVNIRTRTIQFMFNKDIDTTQNLNDVITITKQCVLL